MMKICVEVHSSLDSFEDAEKPFRCYTMNHRYLSETLTVVKRRMIVVLTAAFVYRILYLFQ